jgi:DNA-binding HxlR family transcriptional regulator
MIKKIMPLFGCLFLLSLLQSCKENTQSRQIEEMHLVVMEIHDAVMPKMRDIHQLKKELRSLISERKLSDSLEILETITLLNRADDAMMDWMDEYKKPEEGDDIEKSMAYLEEEKIKITEVSDLMVLSIEKAGALIKRLNEE